MIPSHHKKRNMTLDSMRLGGGRCPPLIVLVLAIACFFLIFNWWTLSTENMELLRQLDQLQDQLKITVEERDKCLTLKDNFEQQYKNSENELGALHVRQQKQKELEIHELTICKSELDSLSKLDVTKTATLEAQRLEKDSLTSQLDAKRGETVKLILELNKTKADLTQLKQTCNKNVDEEKEKENVSKNPFDIDDLGGLENEEKKVPENHKENIADPNIEVQTISKNVNTQIANTTKVVI